MLKIRGVPSTGYATQRFKQISPECPFWTGLYRAGVFKLSMGLGARHRVGIGLSYRPARLHRLAELIPWNRFLGSLNV
jgi:hypothetical protein